jgi:hypothetical protein
MDYGYHEHESFSPTQFDCSDFELWSSQREADGCRFSYQIAVWWIFQIAYLEILSRNGEFNYSGLMAKAVGIQKIQKGYFMGRHC